MNTVTITGRLTQDPKLRSTPAGTSVCQLRLAVDRMARNDETGYVNVTCFGNSAEAAGKVLSKGWKVGVEGRLDYHEWEPGDGPKRSAIEIIGRVEFLAAPRANGEPTPEPAAIGAGADAGEQDIPF